MEHKVVKEFRGVNFVYKVPSAETVTLDFVEKEPWPEKAKALLFQPEVTRETDHEVVWKNIGDKYFCRFYYYARKEDILVPESGSGKALLKRHEFKGPEEMGQVYIDTIDEHFWKPWEKYVLKFYGREKSEAIIREQAKNRLLPEKVFSHEKDGAVVSFLAHTPVHDPITDTDVDWVLWLWIKKELPREERQQIKRDFVGFLRGGAGSQWVLAPTEPFNPRPNIFWQKLGFKLGCFGLTIK